MYKSTKNHHKFIESEINRLSEELKTVKNEKDLVSVQNDISSLNQYNSQMIRNFQHERAIHLIITFFFAALLVISIGILFVFSSSLPFSNQPLFLTMPLLVVLILFITELFYIKHYYNLENGVQKLYSLSEKIYKIK